MKNYIQSGDPATLTAPSGGVESGVGYQIGQLFVVATADAAAGEKFSGKRTGVFTLPRKTADSEWTEGALVYWDADEDEATTTAAENLRIGWSIGGAASAATEADVLLDGGAREDEPQ